MSASACGRRRLCWRTPCRATARYGHGTGGLGSPGAPHRVTGPVSPQLTERMDLLLECLERLQSRLQSQPPVRGDADHLREQIRENSLALGELEKLGVALESVRAQGGELLASMQAANSDAAARGTDTAVRPRARSVPAGPCRGAGSPSAPRGAPG